MYIALVERWLNREEIRIRSQARKRGTPSESLPDKQKLWNVCEIVACWMYDNRVRTLSQTDFKKIIKTIPDIELIEELEHGSKSLLNKQSDSHFRFSHYSIQEFLVVHSRNKELDTQYFTPQMWSFVAHADWAIPIGWINHAPCDILPGTISHKIREIATFYPERGEVGDDHFRRFVFLRLINDVIIFMTQHDNQVTVIDHVKLDGDRTAWLRVFNDKFEIDNFNYWFSLSRINVYASGHISGLEVFTLSNLDLRRRVVMELRYLSCRGALTKELLLLTRNEELHKLIKFFANRKEVFHAFFLSSLHRSARIPFGFQTFISHQPRSIHRHSVNRGPYLKEKYDNWMNTLIQKAILLSWIEWIMVNGKKGKELLLEMEHLNLSDADERSIEELVGYYSQQSLLGENEDKFGSKLMSLYNYYQSSALKDIESHQIATPHIPN